MKFIVSLLCLIAGLLLLLVISLALPITLPFTLPAKWALIAGMLGINVRS